MIPLTVAAAVVDRAERAEHRRDRGRVGREPHRDAGRDAHRALASRRSSRAGRSRARRARARRARRPRPSGSTTSTASTCALVTPAARQCGPPALVRDVAADRARLLRRRIGRVVQARGGAPLRDRSRFRTPGSTQATRAAGVDVEHAVHLRRDDHDRIVERCRAAGEAGAAARARRTAGRDGGRRAPRPRPRRSSAASTPRPRAPSATPASRAYSASSSGSVLARCGTDARRADRRGARGSA